MTWRAWTQNKEKEGPQAWDTGKQTDTVTNGSALNTQCNGNLCGKIYHKTVVKHNKYEHLDITVWC